MRRVLEADADELADCFRSVSRALWDYALLVTRGDRSLADDLVQESFQSAAVRWAKLRDLSNAERLVRLKAITRNKAIDAYRRRRTAEAAQAGMAALQPGHGAGTHGSAMARLADARLSAVIRAMPERQHLIAVMRFRDELTLTEIAAELGVSRATAGREVRRIREIVMDAVGSYIDLGGTD
jgi:RNA polymerase sigma-70 factor (ECF subfamily)